ncbi:MAG: hypothetical protein P8Z42_04365 [Anaerolineales bacterium]
MDEMRDSHEIKVLLVEEKPGEGKRPDEEKETPGKANEAQEKPTYLTVDPKKAASVSIQSTEFTQQEITTYEEGRRAGD